MAKEVLDRTIEILAEQALLAPSDISMDQTPEDLGIDSMALVEVIFTIEEEFDITVPFNANEPGKSAFDISSVAAIVKAVEGFVADQEG